VQVKLLRVLQERQIERLGSSKTRLIDVRVVAATHRDLQSLVAAGSFRPDLYYRLSVFPIQLPPLRERREDIPTLAWFFVRRHQQALARRIRHIPASVMERLQAYDWPGNIRELENVIQRAMIRSGGELLELDDRLDAKPATAAQPRNETLEAIVRAHIEAI